MQLQHALLNRWLHDIYQLGDKDEMSLKHVGHGLASMLASGDWKKAIDYNQPKVKMTKHESQKLDALWSCVTDIMDKKGGQWMADAMAALALTGGVHCQYANTFATNNWMGYREAINRQQLTVTEWK